MSKFNPQWLDPALHPSWQTWLREDEKNPNNAKCLLCHKTFSLSQMGKRAVTSHEEGKWHKKTAAAQTTSVGIRGFFVQKPSSEEVSFFL